MGTSVSSAAMARIRTFAAAAAAFLLALGLAPMATFGSESVAGPLAGPGYEGDAQSASPNSSDEPQQVSASQDAGASRVAPMLASGLFGSPAAIISSDVALDAVDPVVGSFTVDGLTYAINDGNATLVAVSSDLQQVTDSQSADDPRVAPMLAPGQVAIPATVTYGGATYDVTAIGPYSFYLSGATSVELPASIASVDSRAFRSSDVGRVDVVPDNPNIASYDGAIYSADLKSLLLIPEGRAGSVPIPSEAEVVEASKFSHCSLVDAISVDGDGADFASWEGLLYSVDGTTLLRVPAGATEITIRDGCTAIAAGALEGCAKLERINAPATVTSISPDVFQSVPTVSLPAQMAVQDGTTSGVASALADQAKEPADSSGAEGEAEASPRRIVASSQGLEAPLALPDLGSTSASPSSEASSTTEAATQPSSQDEASSGVASALADQAKEPADFIPQLTAMVALSTADDDLPEVDPATLTVNLPEKADSATWQTRGFSVSVATSSSALAAPIQEGATHASNGSVTVHANGHPFPIMENEVRGWQSHNQTWKLFEGTALQVPAIECWYYGYVDPTAGFPGMLFIDEPYSAEGNFMQFELDLWGQYSPTRKEGMDPGYTCVGLSPTNSLGDLLPEDGLLHYTTLDVYVIWQAHTYTVAFDLNGASGAVPSSIAATYDQDATLPAPADRPGYRFLGWDTQADGSGARYQAGAVRNLTAEDGATVTLYAQWEPYEIDFDVDSEPGDIDYPGTPKDPVSGDAAGPDGTIPIEDPKRPGYVFEGWVIPGADGTEAVDQELVYQGDDGKWYVDASKLPDYAGDDGRVELTARWTSVISVDVPSSVTFYADLVTQGQESREGAASGGKSNGVFGQNKLSNQSQVDLRVVGLESSAVKTDGSTLGADSILKKADAATPSTSSQKLLSLYPSTKQWKPEELQNPDAVGGDKATTAVDFDLDDILLEKSFKTDDFTIAAGDTLNMGYRLNLSETGQQLDYDKLSTLSEGQSASIANVSYCFAGDALPLDWGEPLWIENPDRTSNPAKYLLLKDIKEAANDLSANGTSSQYYSLYKGLLDKQVTNNGAPGAGPYFQLRVDGVYLPLQLIGICQDTKSDGSGKAGLTFQMRDVYAHSNMRSAAAGGGVFNTYMNSSETNSGGWNYSAMKAALISTFWSYLPAETQAAIVGVDKFQQLSGGTMASCLQKTTGEVVWLPSAYEVYGAAIQYYNESEALAVNGNVPFQYMAYQGNAGSATDTHAMKTYNGPISDWWLRSANWYYCTTGFNTVASNGAGGCGGAISTYGVAPAFCL